MSETKWTAGPWSLEDNHIVSGAVRVAVTDTPDIHGGVDWIECDYNARLIAAAPELYEALKALADEYEPNMKAFAFNAPRKAMWAAAMAALAKARGE